MNLVFSNSRRPYDLPAIANTVVIPHVHFIHLFKHYQKNPATLNAIKNNKESYANAIHEQLYDDLKNGS
jgi:hypothetical protein